MIDRSISRGEPSEARTQAIGGCRQQLTYASKYSPAQGLIDDGKVVWARDMGPAENQELIDYFKDRHVWLVELDEEPPRLSPYPVLAAP